VPLDRKALNQFPSNLYLILIRHKLE